MTEFNIIIALFIIVLPSGLLWILGSTKKESKNNGLGKTLQVLAIVYLIIGLGICGSLMSV